MPPESTNETSAATTKATTSAQPGAGTTSQKGAGNASPDREASGSRQKEAPAEHMNAFERAKSRRGSGAAAPASDSPAAGLSTGKTAIQKERGLTPGKSALDQLREKSRKHNPSAKVTENEIVADESAMPGKGPSEVEASNEPEVEPLAASGESITEENAVTTPVGDHTPGEGVEPEEVAEPEYAPNIKYKAFGQEHEIPERFRGLITDPESEREVHNVFERAHAFDRYKANLTQLDSDVKTKFVPEIQFHRQTRDQFNQLIQKNDVFGILNKMGIPREKALQAVADRIRIEQLPPEQRAAYDAREQAQATQEQAASQLQVMQTRMQHLESLAKHSEIQSTFARGDVRTVADDFDNRIGQPGAFEALVRDHGALLYSQGRDISPSEAVQAVMQRFGLSFNAKGAGAQGPSSQVSRPMAPQAQARTTPTKVIPNIASRAATTTKSRPQINNLDDLRKFKSQMRGR